MSYALNKMGRQGTHIFITDLKNGPKDQLELKMTNDDIVHQYED